MDVVLARNEDFLRYRVMHGDTIEKEVVPVLQIATLVLEGSDREDTV